jgi:hypothetical protein
MSQSIIDSSVEAVMDLIDGLDLFPSITRGALGTGRTISCEVAPSGPEEVYLDKNQYIVIDLTINAKDGNLQRLSEGMNMIHQCLTMLKAYPENEQWEIVDITTLTEPQVIGREENNEWLMASSLGIKVYTKL